MITLTPPPKDRIVWCCRRFVVNGPTARFGCTLETGALKTEWRLAKRTVDPETHPWTRHGDTANEALLWNGVNDWKDKTWGDILVAGWAEVGPEPALPTEPYHEPR